MRPPRHEMQGVRPTRVVSAQSVRWCSASHAEPTHSQLPSALALRLGCNGRPQRVDDPHAVTDVQMPGMSGIELCVMLRERHPDLLPIIVTGQNGRDR
jgi:CheY-like chemotaxis protein